MSVDYDDRVKCGYVKLRSKKLGVWQKRYVVLKRSSSKGVRRLEKYIDENAAKKCTIHKQIELRDVVRIDQGPDDNKQSMIVLCFGDGTTRHIAFNDEMFNVYMAPSPHVDIYGEMLMQVTAENIQLYDLEDTRAVKLTWPLVSLRRYGRDDSKFTFEAGRRCATGEGMFIFNTVQGEDIYEKVHQATLAIAHASRALHRKESDQQLQQQRTLPLGGQPARSVSLHSNRAPPDAHARVDHTVSAPPAIHDIPLEPPPPPPRTPSDAAESFGSPRVTSFVAAASGGGATQFFQPSPTHGPPSGSPPDGFHGSPMRGGGLTTSPSTTSGEDVSDVIYEEKYLDPKFRRFLQTRKVDES